MQEEQKPPQVEESKLPAKEHEDDPSVSIHSSISEAHIAKTRDVEGLIIGAIAGIVIGILVSFNIIFAMIIGMFLGLIIGTKIKKDKDGSEEGK